MGNIFVPLYKLLAETHRQKISLPGRKTVTGSDAACVHSSLNGVSSVMERQLRNQQKHPVTIFSFLQINLAPVAVELPVFSYFKPPGHTGCENSKLFD